MRYAVKIHQTNANNAISMNPQIASVVHENFLQSPDDNRGP